MKEFLSVVFAIMGMTMLVIRKNVYRELKSQYEYELAIITAIIFWLFGVCCFAAGFCVMMEGVRV